MSSLIINTGRNESHSRSKVFSLPMSPSGSPDREWTNIEEAKGQTPRITLGERLGFEDFFSAKVWQASLVEFLGTAVLVFMCDTIAISSLETNIGGAPTLIMSIFIAITIALLLLATMPASGGHLNPVISLSVGLIGLISLTRAFMYILAQCVGAILGALALKSVVNSKIESTFSLAGCTVTDDWAQAFYLEIICTFVFLFGLRWIAFDPRQAKSFGPIIVCSAIGIFIGLNTFVSTTITGVKGYSGAGMNPARCFGPAIVRGGHLWDAHWIFWVGPMISTIAFYIYTRIVPDDQSEEELHNFASILKACLKVITHKHVI